MFAGKSLTIMEAWLRAKGRQIGGKNQYIVAGAK
jgi:hypothetical protein